MDGDGAGAGGGGWGGCRAVRGGGADGEGSQSGAILGHFAEGSEAKIRLQAGAVELLPSDAREIACDQSEQHAAVLQAAQEGAHAGAGLALEVGDAAHVESRSEERRVGKE